MFPEVYLMVYAGSVRLLMFLENEVSIFIIYSGLEVIFFSPPEGPSIRTYSIWKILIFQGILMPQKEHSCKEEQYGALNLRGREMHKTLPGT